MQTFYMYFEPLYYVMRCDVMYVMVIYMWMQNDMKCMWMVYFLTIDDYYATLEYYYPFDMIHD